MTLTWVARGNAIVVAAALAAAGLTACAPAADEANLEALGITTSTTAAGTVSSTVDPASTSSTTPTESTIASPGVPTLAPDAPASRLAPGDLAPTRYTTSQFAYDLTIDLNNGVWSADEETRTSVHLAQAPDPDFAASTSYDFPLLVLVALTDMDDRAVVATIDDLEAVRFVSSETTEIGGRPALVAEGASRDNPFIPAFPGPSGEPFAGLGGYWFWDPDITGLVYKVWTIDMGSGTVVAWYSAPRSSFDANVAIASAAVESIRFIR